VTEVTSHCAIALVHIQILALSLIAIKDVLIDCLAFWFVQFRRVDPREFVKDCFNRKAHRCPSGLALFSVED
jgi:hypothetical protein